MTAQMTQHEWNTSSDISTLLAFAAGRNAPSQAIVPKVLMSERKLRLFLVACCRAHPELIPPPECQKAIDIAARFADGEAERAQLLTSELSTGEIERAAVDRIARTSTMEEAHLTKMEFYLSGAARITCTPFENLIEPRPYLGRARDYLPLHPRDRSINAERGPGQVADAVAEHLAYTCPEHADDRHAIKTVVRELQSILLREIFGDPFRAEEFDRAWRTTTAVQLAHGVYNELAFDRLPILADALQDAGCNSEDLLSHLRGPGPHVRGCWALDLVLGKE